MSQSNVNVVVVRDESKWEVISAVLEQLGKGGIIIPPEKCEHLDENFPGWEDHLDSWPRYDLDSDTDVVKLVVADGVNSATNTIDDQLIEAQHNQDD